MNKLMEKNIKKIIIFIDIALAISIILSVIELIVSILSLGNISIAQEITESIQQSSFKNLMIINTKNENMGQEIFKIVFLLEVISALGYIKKSLNKILEFRTPFNEETKKYLIKMTKSIGIIAILVVISVIIELAFKIEILNIGLFVPILMFLSLKAIVKIYEYGYELQKQSDETV